MSRFNRSLTRAGVASLAVGVASVLAAPPAGGITAAPVPSVHPTLKPTTPMCLVGAAILYPLFLGGVLLQNPAALPSAAPGYWVGGSRGQQADGRSERYPGWLPACGLPTS